MSHERASGSSPEAEPGHGTQNGIDDEERFFAEATLAEFGDSWKRPNGFASGATPTDVVTERCERRRITETTAVESRETVEVPPSEYESLADERTRFDDRYALVEADSFPDTTVEYVCDVQRVETCARCTGSGRHDCSNCRTGQTRCSTCGGDGMQSCETCGKWASKGPAGRITCPDCNGEGTRGYGEEATRCPSCRGDAHVMCNSCSGSGEHRCTTCGGGGRVTCSTCGGSTEVVCTACNGERELVTADIGAVTFATSRSDAGVSKTGVPEAYIVGQPGTEHRTDDERGHVTQLDTETTVLKRTERYHVDTTRVDYDYGGERWSLYDVEGSIKAESYPKSGTRRTLPVVVSVLFVAVIAVGVYLFLV